MSTLRRYIAAAVFLAALVFVVPGCNDCELQVVTTSLPEAQLGVAYAMFLQSHCGGDTWFINGGGLPPGIGLRDDGLLTGTPTAVGDFAFTVGVFDFSSGEQAFQGLVLSVRDAGT